MNLMSSSFLSMIVGSAVISAIVNGIFSMMLYKKKVSSDIKAKSRIEWIKAVRKSSINYMDSVNEVRDFLFIDQLMANVPEKNNVQKEKKKKMYDEYDEARIDRIFNNFYVQSEKLKLYFADISERKDYTFQELLNIRTNRKKNIQIQNYIDDFANQLSKYPKKSVLPIDLPGTLSLSEIIDCNLMIFEKIMSIYLKIEWDRAKKGK